MPLHLGTARRAALTPVRRADDRSYDVVVDDYGEKDVLGRVYRSGRHWEADAPGRRDVLVHRAPTREQAIVRLLSTPGPLFGDPDESVRHDLG